MADLKIQNAFLDGIEEVYALMFTDRIYFSLLDTEATSVNVYEETTSKKYRDPIKLIGRVSISSNQGEDPVESVQTTATITIPTKQLITHEIPHTTESDLEILRKGKFEYDGVEYLVEKITPRTLVADKWQLYEFSCTVDKKTSLTGSSTIYGVAHATIEDNFLVVKSYDPTLKSSIQGNSLVLEHNPDVPTSQEVDNGIYE